MSVVKKIKDGAGTEYDVGVDASNVSGTLPIANGGTGATTAIAAEYALDSKGATELTSAATDDYRVLFAQTQPSATIGVIAGFRKMSAFWTYIKSKLGVSSGKGSISTPVYVDSNGAIQTCDNWKQGCFIDTHSEGHNTNWIDGLNELYAFYTRGGTCTAYEYDLTWDSSNPPSSTLFTAEDLSAYKTTTSVTAISANVFNSLTGYNQSGVYSGTKFAVYDLTLPATYSYDTWFHWSFGINSWKPEFMQVLASSDSGYYDSKYYSTSCSAYGRASAFGTTSGSGNTKRIRIVVSKYSRLSAFGITNFSSIGLATNYLSRTVDCALYRNISVAQNNTYNLGSSSAKWANVYATNFVGTASKLAKADGTTNVASTVWFSVDSDATRMAQNSNFKYNPSTNVLTVGSITGNAATATTATDYSATGGIATALAGKQDSLSFDGTYDASSNKAATVSTVTTAIGNLNKEDSQVVGQFLTSVTESNGIINVERSSIAVAMVTGLQDALAAKQEALTQGENITIDGNVISATDTTYAETTSDVITEIVNGMDL